MTDFDQQELGRRLRKVREYLSYSQQFVSSETGIPRSAVSDIERGERKVDSLELRRLARCYDYPVTYFLRGEEDAEDDETVRVLARSVESLSEDDKQEVLRFAHFLRHQGRHGRSSK